MGTLRYPTEDAAVPVQNKSGIRTTGGLATPWRHSRPSKAVAGTSVAFPRCGKRLQGRGPRLVGKSDEYRRYARECLEMASAISDPRARASLLQMAQVWFRLADRMPADAKDESHQVEG